MNNQFYTNCKYCGKQILMTRNVNTWKVIPCDPEVIWITPDANGDEYFINPEGDTVKGFRSVLAMNDIGYKKHSASCKGRLR